MQPRRAGNGDIAESERDTQRNADGAFECAVGGRRMSAGSPAASAVYRRHLGYGDNTRDLEWTAPGDLDRCREQPAQRNATDSGRPGRVSHSDLRDHERPVSIFVRQHRAYVAGRLAQPHQRHDRADPVHVSGRAGQSANVWVRVDSVGVCRKQRFAGRGAAAGNPNFACCSGFQT